MTTDRAEGQSGRHPVLLALLPILLIAVGIAILFLLNEGVRTDFLIAWGLLRGGDPDPLMEWMRGFGIWTPVVSAILQVISALIPVLPGFVVAIANGMLFGFWFGGALTFSTALLGAAACFGLARVLGRPGVERIVDAERLARLNAFMERRGMLAIFVSRLIPFINSDVVSYAAGTTRIGWFPFIVAMSAGSLPAVLFYSLVGAFALDASGFVIGMVATASIVPLLIIALIWRLRRSRKGHPEDPRLDEPG